MFTATWGHPHWLITMQILPSPAKPNNSVIATWFQPIGWQHCKHYLAKPHQTTTWFHPQACYNGNHTRPIQTKQFGHCHLVPPHWLETMYALTSQAKQTIWSLPPGCMWQQWEHHPAKPHPTIQTLPPGSTPLANSNANLTKPSQTRQFGHCNLVPPHWQAIMQAVPSPATQVNLVIATCCHPTGWQQCTHYLAKPNRTIRSLPPGSMPTGWQQWEHYPAKPHLTIWSLPPGFSPLAGENANLTKPSPSHTSQFGHCWFTPTW